MNNAITELKEICSVPILKEVHITIRTEENPVLLRTTTKNVKVDFSEEKIKLKQNDGFESVIAIISLNKLSDVKIATETNPNGKKWFDIEFKIENLEYKIFIIR